MAKKRELKEMQDTLDQRESEKIQAAAKAAKAEETLKAAKAAKEDEETLRETLKSQEEARSVRDSLMEEMKIRAQASDYTRLQRENEALMDRVLELERRVEAAEEEAEYERKEAEELRKSREEVIDDDQEEDLDLDETEDNLPEEIRDTLEEDSEEPDDEPDEDSVEDKESVKATTPKASTPAGKSNSKASKAKEGPVMVHTPRSKKQSEVKPDKKVPADKGQASKTLPNILPTPVNPQMTSIGGRSDGPGNAYKYWSWADKCWKITPNIWVADQFGGDFWKTVPVWYKDGQIHHLLSEAECEEYLPR